MTQPAAPADVPETVQRRSVPTREQLASWRTFLRAHALVNRVLEAELEADQQLSLAAYDVLVQLCGTTKDYVPGKPYPATDNKGFLKSYATSTSEPPNVPPPLTAIGDIMRGFRTEKAMPNLYALARDYAICDHWHASMPGPTWPNRFFLHGASSSGLDDSPTEDQTAEWEAKIPAGFEYANGSIFDLLTASSIPFALYNDYTDDWLSAYSDDPDRGSRAGAVPQAAAITNLSMTDYS